MAEEKPEGKRIYCNSCKSYTNHELKGQHKWTQDDPEEAIWEAMIYSLWICAGCETGTLETAYTDSDLHEYDYTYYPKRAFSDLTPKRFVKLNPKLSRIYEETIKCYNDGSLVLCSTGLRALLEGICEDKHIRGRTLSEKINGLQALLPNRNIIRNLHHFRFTGNQAVHKLEAPDAPDVKLAIEVMEDLLNFLYELDYKASRLKRTARKPKAAPPSATALINP